MEANDRRVESPEALPLNDQDFKERCQVRTATARPFVRRMSDLPGLAINSRECTYLFNNVNMYTTDCGRQAGDLLPVVVGGLATGFVPRRTSTPNGVPQG